MNKKIGFFADGPWSHRALERIIEKKTADVAFMVARYPIPDPILREWSARLGIPFFVVEDVNTVEFRNEIRGKSDLNVSLSFNQILKREIIELAPLGFINCHAGALPFYRGRNILNWAIINGETRFGVTIHYVDEGIDTGDIIVQDFVSIESDDDYGSVLEKAFSQCAVSLEKAIANVRDGNVERRPQSEIHSVGFYCGGRRAGDEWIDWSWTSERIHNFVRGIAPPAPGARTRLGQKELGILQTQLIDGAPDYLGTAGEVVGRTDAGSIVKTGDAVILVSEIADCDGLAFSGVRRARFRIGVRLGFNPIARIIELEHRLKKLEDRQ
jgi:methionyl-tRNA formyltransferase